MKDVIKVYAKYLLSVLSVFLLLFVSILIYNAIPLFKVSMNAKETQNLIKIISIPAFYHSLFNSLIISLFLYGVTALNFHHKNKLINFFLPVLTSSIIIFFVLFYLKPTSGDLNFLKLDDARLYLPQNTFIENSNLKIYFDSVNKDDINKIILIENNNVTFFKNSVIKFSDDKLTVNIRNKNNQTKSIEFPKSELNTFYIQGMNINNSFFTQLNRASYKFIFSQDIYANILLWISLALFILTLTSIFKIKNNPILSLIFNLLFIILFYHIFNYIFDFYNKIAKDVFSSQIIRDTFLGMSIIIISCILQLFNFIFFRTHESEE